MYRAATFAALRDRVDLGDEAAVVAATLAEPIDVADRVMVDGDDATDDIRGPEVSAAVSIGRRAPGGARASMRDRQRAWAAEHGGGVIEGRDIGTVVFPDADAEGVPDRHAPRCGPDAGPPRWARSTRRPSPNGPRTSAQRDHLRLDPSGLAVAGGRRRRRGRHERPSPSTRSWTRS